MERYLLDAETVREVVQLYARYGGSLDIRQALDIRNEWDRCFGEENMWDFCRMFGAIYTAGRIAGIRSERRRRRK